ncbi:MAG: hypothetical protein HYY06_33210 [Deltaproteobacteria bacterium]|nr:hypothetical protein [Deltaproteobacteria bacterium]
MRRFWTHPMVRLLLISSSFTAEVAAGCGGEKAGDEPTPDAGTGPRCDPGEPDRSGCDVVVLTPSGETFTEDNSIFDGVVIEDDSITLSAEAVVNDVIWIANSTEGSVSKIDTTTHEELGRYYSGPALVETTAAPVAGQCPEGYELRDPATCVQLGYGSSGVWGGPGQNPSRTSVDRLGNAYVANRSWDWLPSVTKINHRCTARDDIVGLRTWVPDGDGDPANDPPPLDFRRDTNGTPGNPWDDSYTWDDDCIAFHTVAALDPLDRITNGTPDEADDSASAFRSLGRGVVVQEVRQPSGLFHTFGWLAAFAVRRYYEFDGDTGELTGRVIHFPSCTPYGAAIDRFGVLWSACYSGVIGRADTRLRLADDDLVDGIPDVPVAGTAHRCVDVNGQETEYTCIEGEEIAIPGDWSYGIAVAPPVRDDDPPLRIFTANWNIMEYIPSEDGDPGIWIRYDGGSGEGIAVDREGIVWANTGNAAVVRANPYRVPFDPVTGLPDLVPDANGMYIAPAEAVTRIPTGRGGRGIGVATDGMIWAINWSHWDPVANAQNDGNVTLVDPHPAEDADQDGDPDVAAPEAYLAGTCCEEVDVPYTYSDMTGFQYANVVIPLGELRFFVPGCTSGVTEWGNVAIEGELPEGTGLALQAKLVDDLGDVAGGDRWETLSLEDGGGNVMDATHPPGGRGGTFVMPDLEGGEPNLGLRATLIAEDRARRPAVSSIQIARACR